MRALRFFRTTILLALFWALLSGEFDAFHLSLGILASAGVAAVAIRATAFPPFPVVRFLVYVPWLLWQVLVSNLRVARLALSPRPALAPRMIDLPPGVRGDVPLTVLGCSITLTPGTVTVDADDRLLRVHALDEASAREIEDALMARRVRGLFRQEEA